MLFVGQFRVDRSQDLEFWAVLWQGHDVPRDLKLIAAYNLLSDLRIIVFEADSIASVRWLDRLNFVGHFECQPALDQTDGYQAALSRDTERLEGFLRNRKVSEAIIARESSFRARAIESPNIWTALALGREQRSLLESEAAAIPGDQAPEPQ